MADQGTQKQPLLGGSTSQAPGTSHTHVVVDGSNGHSETGPSSQDSYWDLVKPFSVLGWTAFGGPTAHLARFHKNFVGDGKWFSEGLYAELLAICGMLPGPTSTQMSFALGILLKGPVGGLISGILFQYPGLLLLSLAGFGAAQVLVEPPKWLVAFSAGLVAVAVALVAEAALVLGNKLCKIKATQLICCTSALLAFAFPTQWLFPALILGGGLVMVVASDWGLLGVTPSGSSDRMGGANHDEATETIEHLGITPLAGLILIILWLAILVASVVGKKLIPYESAPWIHWFEAFYVTGSMAYGGGQVMLPFLQHVVVQYETVCPPTPVNLTSLSLPFYPTPITLSPHSLVDGRSPLQHLGFYAPQPCHQVESNSTWVTEQQFLTGLGIVQAMPGPLFNFAAYLGAVMGGVPGALVCWLGLFGPGLLLVYAALPFWSRFRSWAAYKKALPGLNAAAVGLIYAAVFQLGFSTYSGSPFPAASVSIAMGGYGASAFLGVPAPVAILLGALAGTWVWAAGGM